jgi:MerR family transcriptional regulator, global nitrogen regulator
MNIYKNKLPILGSFFSKKLLLKIIRYVRLYNISCNTILIFIYLYVFNELNESGENISMENEQSYKDKKVITIGVVRELTGLSERQIRYYEERKLIFPDRSSGGSRKYSFSDIELLMEIANKIEDGVQTYEIRQEMKKKQTEKDAKAIRNKMIQGQLNAQFGIRKQ